MFLKVAITGMPDDFTHDKVTLKQCKCSTFEHIQVILHVQSTSIVVKVLTPWLTLNASFLETPHL